MSTESIAVLQVAPRGDRFLSRLGAAADYWALTKPEVNLLIAITTITGFCLGRPPGSPFPITALFHTVLGTLLVAGGTGTLNQVVEQRFDAEMRRTKRRPVASGRVRRAHALWFGTVLSLAGALYLWLATNIFASAIAILTLLSYLLIYTPLKRMTPFCTLAGAFPGAAPPLIGWAAASGRLNAEAWVLYAILFLWQFPHFMAIAWMYRRDYVRAGYLVLPNLGRARRKFMTSQLMLPSIALLIMSFVPKALGFAGSLYMNGALLLSFAFVFFSTELVLEKTNAAARRLLMASIVYLPLMFFLMVIDKFV